MSCNSEDILANISLKKHFWKDLKGVSKKSFILKDPVCQLAPIFYCSPLSLKLPVQLPAPHYTLPPGAVE